MTQRDASNGEDTRLMEAHVSRKQMNFPDFLSLCIVFAVNQSGFENGAVSVKDG
ncbi:hypothetical protein [Pseudomonas sp. S2_H01]